MVKKIDVVAVTEGVAAPIATNLGLELIDVEYVKEGAAWYLRLYVDKPGGVGLDDCQAVSEAVGTKLDEIDPIPDNYYLEVSSPGIERPLKKDRDFERYTGREVLINTFAPMDGQKDFLGELLGLVEDHVQMRLRDGREISLPKDKISKANLHVDF